MSNSSAPYEYLYLATSGDKNSINRAASIDQYVQMSIPKQRLQHSHEDLLESNAVRNLNDGDEPPSAAMMRSYNPNRKLRRMPNNYDNFCPR